MTPEKRATAIATRFTSKIALAGSFCGWAPHVSGLHWVYNAVLGKMKGKSATALSHAQSDSDLLNVLVLAPLRNSRSNTDLFGCSFIDLYEPG